MKKSQDSSPLYIFRITNSSSWLLSVRNICITIFLEEKNVLSYVKMEDKGQGEETYILQEDGRIQSYKDFKQFISWVQFPEMAMTSGHSFLQ